MGEIAVVYTGIHHHPGIRRPFGLLGNRHGGDPELGSLGAAVAKEAHHQVALGSNVIPVGPDAVDIDFPVIQPQALMAQVDPNPGPLSGTQGGIPQPPHTGGGIFRFGIDIEFRQIIAGVVKFPQEHEVVVAGNRDLYRAIIATMPDSAVKAHRILAGANAGHAEIVDAHDRGFRPVECLYHILPIHRLKAQRIGRHTVDGEIIQDHSLGRLRNQGNRIPLHIGGLFHGAVLRGHADRAIHPCLNRGDPELRAGAAALSHEPQHQSTHIGLALMIGVGAEIIAACVMQIYARICQLDPDSGPLAGLQLGVAQPIGAGHGVLSFGINPEIHIVIAGKPEHIQAHAHISRFGRHLDRAAVSTMGNAAVIGYRIAVRIDGGYRRGAGLHDQARASLHRYACGGMQLALPVGILCGIVQVQADRAPVGNRYISSGHSAGRSGAVRGGKAEPDPLCHIAVNVLQDRSRSTVAVAVDDCQSAVVLHIQIILVGIVYQLGPLFAHHCLEVLDGGERDPLLLHPSRVAEPIPLDRLVADGGLADENIIHKEIKVIFSANCQHIHGILFRGRNEPADHPCGQGRHYIVPGAVAVPFAGGLRPAVDLELDNMGLAHMHRHIKELVGGNAAVIAAGDIKAQRPGGSLVGAQRLAVVAVQPPHIAIPLRIIEALAPGHVLNGKLVRILNSDLMFFLGGNKGIAHHRNAVYQEAVYHLALELLRPEEHGIALGVLGFVQQHMLARLQNTGAPMHPHRPHGRKVESTGGNHLSAVVENEANIGAGNIRSSDGLNIIRSDISVGSAPAVHRPGQAGPFALFHRLVIPPAGAHDDVRVAVVVDIHFQLNAVADIQNCRGLHDDIPLVALGLHTGKAHLIRAGILTVHPIRSFRSGNKFAGIFGRLQHLHLALAEFLSKIENRILIIVLGAVHTAGVLIVVKVARRVLHMDADGILAVPLLHLEAVALDFHFPFRAAVGKIECLRPAFFLGRVPRHGVGGHLIGVSGDEEVRQGSSQADRRRSPVAKVHQYRHIPDISRVCRIHEGIHARGLHHNGAVRSIHRFAVGIRYRSKPRAVVRQDHAAAVHDIIIRDGICTQIFQNHIAWGINIRIDAAAQREINTAGQSQHKYNTAQPYEYPSFLS